MANENSSFDMWKDILEKQAEESRMRTEEFQIRYAERKRQKQERCRMIENTAVKICAAAEKIAVNADGMSTEELAKLAAAINGAALAMQSAEMYAEYTPLSYGAFGLGCAV